MPGVNVPDPEEVVPGCNEDKGGVAESRLGLSGVIFNDLGCCCCLGKCCGIIVTAPVDEDGVAASSPTLEFLDESRLSLGLHKSPPAPVLSPGVVGNKLEDCAVLEMAMGVIGV